MPHRNRSTVEKIVVARAMRLCYFHSRRHLDREVGRLRALENFVGKSRGSAVDIGNIGPGADTSILGEHLPRL
jgi:hypothetical protein